MSLILSIFGGIFVTFSLIGIQSIKDGRVGVSDDNVPDLLKTFKLVLWLGVFLLGGSGSILTFSKIEEIVQKPITIPPCVGNQCEPNKNTPEKPFVKEKSPEAPSKDIPEAILINNYNQSNFKEGVNKCSLTIMTGENCVTFVNTLLKEYGKIDFVHKDTQFKNVKYTTDCPEGTWVEKEHARMGVEAQFIHPSLPISMEVEKDKHARKIEDEFEGIDISLLPSKVYDQLKLDFPDKKITDFEKEVRHDGTIIYEFELDDDTDTDVAYDENGNRIYNTCEGGTPECPECP